MNLIVTASNMPNNTHPFFFSFPLPYPFTMAPSAPGRVPSWKEKQKDDLATDPMLEEEQASDLRRDPWALLVSPECTCGLVLSVLHHLILSLSSLPANPFLS